MSIIDEIDGLDFRNCTFPLIDSNAFGGLKIRTLNFIHCRIRSEHKSYLNGLDYLTSLTLNFICYEREDEILYKHYQTEEDKFMMEMRFNQVDRNSYLFRNLLDCNLKSLKKANLNNNKIRTITKRMFSDLLNLEELFLEENEIDLIEDNSFNGLSKLRKLMLRKNQIRKINEFTFKGLTGLVYLNLSDNPIYSTDKEAFSDFINAEIIREIKNFI
ncbi:leucine-rich repeats and immunoglobulin-like domains 2 [Brachionus plicatilis]|uniref:Leucine-rich repeats and immunoglobulin-like domains 2 n=1 Tax=Brachionus plicatilis TaxID=10195 RepID=A0A3M7QGV5_BRAPC|nr:leucine-rich repeats and immunoglobulin-like domains 2 [Brachionus plicatilis]